MSQETPRYLISRIKKRKTEKGQVVVDLYGGGAHSKLKYPVLTLFDLAELAVVNIDPNTLDDSEYHCRFFAYYEEGEKLNQEKNPYKNVLYLENVNSPSPSATDTDRILEAMRILYRELREIKNAVLAIQSGKPSVPCPPITEPPSPANVPGPPLPTLSENEARNTFYALAGPAINGGQIPANDSNELSQAANSSSWNAVLAQLQARLK